MEIKNEQLDTEEYRLGAGKCFELKVLKVGTTNRFFCIIGRYQ